MIEISANQQARSVESGSDGRYAFTLIELLVVVAIIALLIAILLPSLAVAREQAKSTVCKAHLSQIGTAFYNYLSDNNPGSRPGTYFNYTSGTATITVYWNYSMSTDPANPPAQYDPLGGWMTSSMKTAAVLECPSLIGIVPPDSITNLSCAYAGNGSVGVNYAINASGAPVNLYIESPQNTVAFAEAIGYSHGTTTPTLVRYGGYMVSPSNNNSPYGGRPSFHGRHLKKGNVLWYDGHVTSEIPFIQTLGLDTTYGWSAAPCVQFNIGQITPVPPGSSQITYLTALNKDFYFWADKTNQK